MIYAMLIPLSSVRLGVLAEQTITSGRPLEEAILIIQVDIERAIATTVCRLHYCVIVGQLAIDV
jgi:hypothetical protein